MPAAQGEELSPRLGDPSLSAFVAAYDIKSSLHVQGDEICEDIMHGGTLVFGRDV